jgi:hypothetical protein
VLAVETGTTGDGEWGNDAIAGFELCDGGPDAAYFAGEFVAHDEFGTGWLVAAEYV